ncbi:hypothetical protein EGW03_00535 [bacterium]|nr:hypothetical protein [bacterium]
MKEKIIAEIGNRLDDLNLFIDDIAYGKVDNENTLTIILDSSEIIPLNKVVMATRIINPILDKLDLIKESYTLDVYAKEKGDVKNEW